MSCQQRSVCRVGCERNRVNTAVAGSRDKLPETGRQAGHAPARGPCIKMAGKAGGRLCGLQRKPRHRQRQPAVSFCPIPANALAVTFRSTASQEEVLSHTYLKAHANCRRTDGGAPSGRCQHARNRRAAVYRNRDEGPNRGFAIAKPAAVSQRLSGVCETGQRFPRRFAIRLDDRLPEAAGDLF